MEQGRKVILSWIILIFASPTTGQQIQSTASTRGPTTISPTTGPQRPSAPLANVSGHNTSSTSIFVQWDQVPAAHQNGAILYYTVTYRALPSGSVQTNNVTAPASQMTLTGLNKYTNYSITVFASTSRGAGNVTAPIFIVTDEDRPSAPPANISGYNTSSTSIFVQWNQVPAAHQNGVILYYTITHSSYCSGNFSTVIVAAPTTQTTLTGLNQGTLYRISVSASTIKGAGSSFYIGIETGCARDHLILNGTNGEIFFCMNDFHDYYNDRSITHLESYYSQTCSWKIMADKGEQVKLVLKRVKITLCGSSCSCGHLEIENGTYADGSTTTRMCSNLLGNVTIYSHFGHGLGIQSVTHASWSIYFWASYTVISHKDTVSDECSNHTILNESNRAVTYTGRSLGNLFDSHLSGWYRFRGEAGTQMADACPKMYSCSTNSSGWLNGTHPTVAEGTVKRKVCFSQRVSQFLKDCCNHSKNISVRNCGAFYVYRVDPSDYYSRYCGNGLSQAPECSNYQFLNDCSRAVTYQRVFSYCNDTTKLLGWYRFGGEAGTQMADTCVKQRHCGASSPGWLRGGHPSVSDGAVLRKVCFTGYRGCCQYSTFISVRNCSGFYVYKLSPVYPHYSCNFRYCSSYGFELSTTSTSGVFIPLAMTTVSPYTGSLRSSAPPANVSGYNISSTTIFVQWDQVPTAHHNHALLYYTVTYTALPSGLQQTEIVAAPAHQTTLTGLNKYTNYSITVFASTCKAGNVSAPIFIVTDEDTPSAPPANVTGNSKSSTSIFVQWDQVPPSYQNGVILFYTVTYRLYNRYRRFLHRVIVAVPTTQTTLTGLNQGTLYTISVSASTSKGRGPSTYIHIPTRCSGEQEFLNRTNGEIIFHGNYPYHYYYYQRNQLCSWNIMAHKGEQVKLVLKHVDLHWCGWSCSCGHLEIENGTYEDGSATTRMCNNLLGNVTIYSHVGYGLTLNALYFAFRSLFFRASYTVISHKDTESDECSNYTFLNDLSRAITYADRSLGSLSDSNLSGWYRFSGEAGTQMAEACPKMYSCSTNSSGWLNGAHPTVAEGTVKRQVCFSQRVSQFFNDCCNHSKNIGVRNCGAFYVYRLDPPDYYSRYCGNGLPQAPECSNYKFLNDSNRAVTFNQSVLGNCDDTTKLLGWYRFGGEAGTQMSDTCVNQRHCGASSPGWLRGGHPSVSDGAVLRKVCFTGYRGCCHHSTFISVRNCNGFYIYKLSPVVPYSSQCNYRYCSSQGFGLPTTSTTECSKYTFLNESNRAMTYTDRSLGNLSDSNLSGWYRFSGGAGTQMAEACPKMYSCSTNLSGWLSGTHPTVTEGIVQGKVCFSQRASQFFNDCCYHSKNISVRNCGTFYVYRLDPPGYYSRYCGNAFLQAPECSNYRFLNDCSRAVAYNRSVFVNCYDTSKLLGWYRSGGEAGTQMADTCVKQRHCGASYPGWLSGGHPSVSDGAVLRKVCFTGYWGCCHYSTFISVRNCGGFFVYKLSPVHPYYYCHFRYCLGNGFELPTTSAAGPSAPPMNVSGYNTSSTSIFVHWDQVPDAYQNGALLYYTVTYRALPSGFRQTVVVAAPAHQTTLTGLNKYTNYSITVFASTCKGAGNVSAPFFIVTDEDRPSGYPVNVRGNTISSTSIFVQWDEVPTARQNGVILYYTITYRPYSVFCLVNVFAPKTQITLTGLNESTIYWISVSASTIKGHGPARHISIATACARQQKILNARNGKIIFSSYYYRYNQTCSWKIVANKSEQVKLVLESVHFRWCGLSCSCGRLEIQDGTHADGFTTTRICSHLLGNTIIYSHVGHGLRIQAVTHASWWNSFRASYTVISHKDNVSDECSNYKFLNDSNRAVKYVNKNLDNLSDIKLSGWYRFSGGAGAQMAEACPKMYSCSTNSSGWLNGTHPTVAEGIVQRKVCFSQRVSHSLFDCCNHSKNISVRNCGAFYVYRLDPPDYYSRYCGNGLPQAPECSNYKFLNDSSRAVTFNLTVLMNCNDTTKLHGWYRFGGEAGTQMADTCVRWRHCGVLYPGWLSGGHPSVSDGAVLRKVCFTEYMGSCCYSSTFISVRNCNEFYVYKLSPFYRPHSYNCPFRYCSNSGFKLPTTSTTAKILTTATTEKTTEPTTYKPTTEPSTTPTTSKPTILVMNVWITEGDQLTLNCSSKINTQELPREEGVPVVSESRTLVDGESRPISSSASVKDSGKYLCKNDKERYIFNVSVKVLVKVEMVISVLSYTFTPELQNKSSQVYKETEKNFTSEMDKVYNSTPGYVRTEVLNFTKGSVKVDFRVIIVFVATDPKNQSTIVDKKATTGQRIIKEAQKGLVSRLRVKPQVIVKTPPPEPREQGFFDVKSDQISIQWMAPEGFKAFDIKSYEVKHWPFGAEGHGLPHKLPALEGKTQYSHRIQNLKPETTYMISVAAVNDYGSNYNEAKGQQTLAVSLAGWAIALIVLAVLFVAAVIVGAVFYVHQRVLRRDQHYEVDALDVMDRPKKFEGLFYQEQNVKGLNFEFKNISYEADGNWTEIPYENIKLMDELGSGAFGVVYKGEISEKNGNITPCAVKALKAAATDEEMRDLYNELEIMSSIGSHPNLVNLLGACTKDGNLLVVLEIAENGSLIEFLKKVRSKNGNYEGEGVAEIQGGLSTDMKLSIAVDVAKGMAYLASHRCIHRDLAARNVLLGKNYVAKVADYGMARDIYEQLMYKKETQGKLPVKWMAIESLETYVFTVESDVWSYGVLLWEMETGGLKPYPGLTATELMAELKKGYRLEKPTGCSHAMYQVMTDCWHSNPGLRPTFDQLVKRLEEMSESS